jgi:hypothetical protein
MFSPPSCLGAEYRGLHAKAAGTLTSLARPQFAGAA